MRLTESAQGVYPNAPTPFFDGGRIDSASIDRRVDFYLGIGATGLTVLGQLGEAPKLGHAEAVAVARRMIRRASALPVIVGVSAPGFSAMRELTLVVMAAGAAGVMIAPPNTLRSDEQIVGYYRQAAHDLFDVHLPLLRFKQQPGVGLAVRKYLLMRRGLLSGAAMCVPAAALTALARTEFEYLRARLARHDARARLASC